MKPEIVGKILNLPVLEPNDPLIISGCADGEPKITVKRGLVRFGSKGAFLGCPMFHENRAYSESVLLTVMQNGDADLDVILEGPEVVGALIEALIEARDKMVGWDDRYDQIVGYEQIWDAACADTRESFPTLEEPGPCPSCDGSGFGDGPDDLCGLCLGTGKAGADIEKRSDAEV